MSWEKHVKNVMTNVERAGVALGILTAYEVQISYETERGFLIGDVEHALFGDFLTGAKDMQEAANNVYEVFEDRLQGKILRFFVQHPDAQTGREIDIVKARKAKTRTYEFNSKRTS